MKPNTSNTRTRRTLTLNQETVRCLSAIELDGVAAGLDPVGGTGSVYQCRTLISCAACSELRCIINTSVITSCR